MNNSSDLGNRICIIGLSSAGKSTLAKALNEKLGFSVLYLDQIAHQPNTNWKLRDRNLLAKDHNDFIINTESWIIEGNYSFLMPLRFSKASTVIWFDYNRFTSLFSYIKRSLFDNERVGALEGAKKELSLKQIKQILFVAPRNRKKYKDLINDSGVNCIRIKNFRGLNAFRKQQNLI